MDTRRSSRITDWPSKYFSEISISLTDRFMGGQAVFQAELQAGMRQTLARVKHLAEQGVLA